MNLPNHLAELAVAIEIAVDRDEAWRAVETFLESAAARQISRQGQ
jgi:hypothetical protein